MGKSTDIVANWLKFDQIGLTVFQIVVLLAVSISFYAFAADQPPKKEDDSGKIEEFKTFLEFRPFIKEIVYETQRLMSGPGMALTNIDVYQGKWQSNGMVVRQLNSLQERSDLTAKPGNMFCGRSEQNYWSIRRNGLVMVWVESGSEAKESVASRGEVLLGSQVLDRILNLGIVELKTGSLKWSGRHFTALNLRTNAIEGELFTSSDGSPERLEITYSNPLVKTHWQIKYAYEDASLIPMIPSEVLVQFMAADGKIIPYDRFKILSIETTKDPLPKENFSLSSYTNESKTTIFSYTNGQVYVKSPGREMQPVGEGVSGGGGRRYLLGKKSYFFSTVFCFTAILTIVAVKKTNQRKQNENAK